MRDGGGQRAAKEVAGGALRGSLGGSGWDKSFPANGTEKREKK